VQGDYDPTKTKVIHFEMNPVAMAAKQKAAELQMLREENEALKQRLKILEESGGQAEDVTEQVQKRLQEPCSSKEVDGKKLVGFFWGGGFSFTLFVYQMLMVMVNIKSVQSRRTNLILLLFIFQLQINQTVLSNLLIAFYILH
jgi:hypothetical protein